MVKDKQTTAKFGQNRIAPHHVDGSAPGRHCRSMSRAERIESALKRALAPDVLAVADESENHRGHSGYRDGGETHYRVAIVSGVFRGKNRVERHRLVNVALAAEFASGLHALALDLRAPEEG